MNLKKRFINTIKNYNKTAVILISFLFLITSSNAWDVTLDLNSQDAAGYHDANDGSSADSNEVPPSTNSRIGTDISDQSITKNDTFDTINLSKSADANNEPPIPQPLDSSIGEIWVNVTKEVYPIVIHPCEPATISINVTVEGDPVIELPVAVMLVIDTSGSMGWEYENETGVMHPALYYIKNAANTFIDQMDLTNDTIGVTSFARYGTLNQPLTHNGTAAKNAINTLTDNGATNPGEGIRIAQQEIAANCPPDATPIILLFTDGLPTAHGAGGSYCNDNCPTSNNTCTDYAIEQADDSKDANTTIFSIGFTGAILSVSSECSDPDVVVFAEWLLTNISSGEDYYYGAPNATDIEDIYLNISQKIYDIPISNLIVSDFLPPHFIIINDGGGNHSILLNGTHKIEFTRSFLALNDLWNINFEVTTHELGDLLLTNHPNSNLTHTLDNTSHISYLPYPRYINVISPLEIEKNAPLIVNPGDQFNYSVIINNIGHMTLDNIIIYDSLSSKISFNSINSTYSGFDEDNWNYSDYTLIINNIPLNIGEIIEFNISVTVSDTASGDIQNTVFGGYSTLTGCTIIDICNSSVTTNINNPPVVTDIPNQTIAEGSTFATINLDDYVSDIEDPDEDILWEYNGNVELSVDIIDRISTITIPDPDWYGEEIIIFTATDTGGLYNFDDATFTVISVNDPPELTLPGLPSSINELEEWSFTATATDPDVPAQTLTFSVEDGVGGSVPSGASIDGVTGVFTWIPTEIQGPDSFTFDVVVSDGIDTDSETITVVVDEVNLNPVLDFIGDQAVIEQTLLTFTATAVDDDVPVQILSFSLDGSVPSGASITSGGVFTWIPDEDQGPDSYTFDVVVKDEDLAEDRETITIVVTEGNVPPELILPSLPSNIDELILWSFTATATDEDIPAQTLTFSLEDGVGGSVPSGASIDGVTGVFTWIPDEDQGPDSYTFDVVVKDEDLAEDRETITIVVTEGNVPPELILPSLPSNIDELILWSFTAAATDDDIPAQTLTFSLEDGVGGSVPSGASIDGVTGVFTWIPTEIQGPDSFTFDVVVSDGIDTDSETITVVVDEVNLNPVLDFIGDQAVIEQTLLTFTATAVDDDVPVQILSFSLDGSVPSGASITSGGVFTWIPDEDQGPDSYTFDVVVKDEDLAEDRETITIVVTEGNVPPELILPSLPSNIDELILWSFTATATDEDIPAQTLTFSLEDGVGGSVPSGASIDGVTGVFTWIPTEIQGPDSFTFDVVVSDGIDTDSETITVVVDEVNLNPVLDFIGDQAVIEQTLLTFTATAVDDDVPVQILSFSLDGSVPSGASITSGGVFTWIPDEDQGPDSYTFDVVVKDEDLAEDRETITIVVTEGNVPPELILPSLPSNIDELILWSFTATATDEDIPAQTLTFSLEDGVGGSVPSGASIDGVTGVFTWIPTEIQGPDSFTFDVVVSDGIDTDSETITVVVDEVNLNPVLDFIGDQAVIEQTLLTFTATAVDDDVPVQILSFSLDGSVPSGASITSGGVFTWIPDEDQGPDSYTFDVVVKDEDLAEDRETITIVVTEGNVPPELILPSLPSNIDELILWSFTAAATDEDIPAQTLTFSLEDGVGGSVPSGASIDGVTGVFTWIPTEIQGPDSFTFDVVVSDGIDTDSETITVVVDEVNLNPVLDFIGDQAVIEQTLLTFTATAVDDDVPVQILSFSLDGSVPSGASITSGGVFTWIPDEDQGPDSYTFDVVVKDEDLAEDRETITIVVTEGNVPPELILPSLPSNIDELILWSFTAAATDDDIPAQTLTFSLEDGVGGSVPSGASIDGVTGVFTWIPTEIQGPDSFTFDVVVSDGIDTDSETITVVVDEVNLNPVLDFIGDQAVIEQTLLTFTATAVDDDVPVQILSFSLDGSVPSGASITSGGVFTWIPDEDQGPDSYTFDVVVKDEDLAEDRETITIVVTEGNVPPELILPSLPSNIDELILWSFTAAATDEDIPAQTLTFSLEDGVGGSVPSGASIDGVTGVFTWIPTEIQGPDSFTFDVVVSDGIDTDSETITVVVDEVNLNPVLDFIGDQAVIEQTLLTFTATAVDDDVPVQILSFSLDGSVPSGASITSGGVFTWIPDEDQGPDSYTFDVVVKDEDLAEDRETITIVVTEGNVPPELILPSLPSNIDELILWSFTAAATDEDIPAQTLTFSLEDGVGGSVPSGASIDGVTGVFTWIPTDIQGPGDYMFDIVVTDGIEIDNETVNISVDNVNDPPYAPSNPDPYDGETGIILNPTLIVNVSDPEGNTLDVKFYNEFDGSLIGIDTNVSSGGKASITWSTLDYSTTYEWYAVANDSELINQSDTWSFTTIPYIPPPPSNTNPVANDDNTSTYVGTAVWIDVLNNDHDNEGPLDPSTVIVTNDPSNGGTIVNTTNGEIQYTPDSDYNGTDSFRYKVMDYDGAVSNKATVTILVIDGVIADASAGSPYYGFIGEEITFNGSLSHSTDPEGFIVTWHWNFGDGTNGNGETATHTYSNAGTYDATLTVTGNNGDNDTDNFNVIIVKGNKPPLKPTIGGPKTGHKNTTYEFTFLSKDLDNDTIKYYVDWGDGNVNESDFLSNGTAFEIFHSWTSYGEYLISVIAYDNETESETTESAILIDVIPIDDEIKGYLVDEDSDDIFDFFKNTNTQEINDIIKENNTYLIDSDGDNKWDHTYSQNEGALTYYEYIYLKYYQKYKTTTPGFEIISLLAMIAIVLIIMKRRKTKGV